MPTMKPPMKPFLFLRRGRVWTLVKVGLDGRKRQKATKFRGPEQEHAARKWLAMELEKLAASKRVDQGDEGRPLTVARHAVQFLEGRRRKGISTVSRYETQLRLHILPYIGHLRLDAVNIDHIEEVMAAAARVDPISRRPFISPTTQTHVYRTMRTMFNRAIPRLIATNPCQIQSDELPKRDALEAVEWREAAIFTRAEVQTMITDPRLQPARRVFYAVMFLTGMRFGEIAALHLRDLRLSMEPLGQIKVLKSYNYEQRRVKSTKTGVKRSVPVHPWLAEILGWWVHHGWAEMMKGRQPTPEDILIPTRTGSRRSRHQGWNDFQADLEKVGFRGRRQHDSRATFVSLTLDDGGNEGILRWVTHGEPKKDAFDLYRREPAWRVACAEVAKLKLGPPSPAPLKSLNSLEHGLPPGCHGGEAMEIIRKNTVTPPGIEGGNNNRTQSASDRQQSTFGRVYNDSSTTDRTGAARDGQFRPTGNLATLALRQALAALDKGRIDQARELLSRAIEKEREGDDDEVAS